MTPRGSGRRVGELDLPGGVLPVAVLHAEQMRGATADAVLEEGDVVYLLGQDSDELDEAVGQLEG